MPDIPNRDALENELARKLARLFAAFVGHVLELIGNGEITATNIPADVMDQLTADEKAVLLPFLERVAMESAERLDDAVPIGADWDLISSVAANWARLYTFDLVKGIDDNSMKLLRRSIANYFELGQTMGDLRKALSTGRNGFGPARAQLIAVTEVTRAAVEGEMGMAAGLAEQGILMTADWVTNYDESVCPICRPLNQRNADGYDPPRRPFWIHPKSGKRYGPPPSAHPGDRCWVNWSLPRG